MEKKFVLMLLYVVTLLFSSCNSDNEFELDTAPSIQSIIALDPVSGESLQIPIHKASEDMSIIDVMTPNEYTFAVTIKTSSPDITSKIVTGEDWLSISKDISVKEGLSRFVLTCSTNKEENGRIGSVIFYITSDPSKSVKLTITQIGSTTKDEMAPRITSVIAIDNTTGEPLKEAKHETEPPFTYIGVNTSEKYTLNIYVESKSSTFIDVVEGQNWLGTELIENIDTEGKQVYKISLTENKLTSMRYGLLQ